MTPKQQERIVNKIKKIKAALAADKKRWGGFYNDGQGLRYAPPRLYIQIGDFAGAARYFNWFNKNFPDDSGYPDFLFEWTIVLYMTGRIKDAERKAFRTYVRNVYLFDKYFDKPLNTIEKWEGSNLETARFATDYFAYSHKQENLSDFSQWLSDFIQSEKFITVKNKYLEIQTQLNHEHDVEKRMRLIRQTYKLENEF